MATRNECKACNFSTKIFALNAKPDRLLSEGRLAQQQSAQGEHARAAETLEGRGTSPFLHFHCVSVYRIPFVFYSILCCIVITF